MQPTHNSSRSRSLYTRQKYFFPLQGNDIPAWNQALTTLFPEPKFHDVIEAHGVEGYVDANWHIRFKRIDDTPVNNGPRWSRLMKALWDNFGPVFDDYGVRLKNHHTDKLVPIIKKETL